MKIQNALFENKQYIETMQKIHTSDKLTVLDAYRINRLIKQLQSLSDEYIELKTNLLKKFGKPDSDSDSGKEQSEEKIYTVEPKNQKEFTKEMNDLLNIEHDLEIEKLSFPSKIDEGITVIDIDILNIFFDFGFDEKEKKKK